MQPYPNRGGMPVRYMLPPGYRQDYPPFVNPSFDRYAVRPITDRDPRMWRPGNNPPSYGPGYGQGNPPANGQGNPPANGQGNPQPQRAPTANVNKNSMQPQKRMPGQQQQPGGQPYNNPNSKDKRNPDLTTSRSKTPGYRKGTKEFRDTAFTIEPDGTRNNAIKGLVSNDDINNLLKHKGTKVKVAKIYRITKTKAEDDPDSSEEELPPAPPPPPPVQRPVSVASSSGSSYCSLCNDRPCSQCLNVRTVHVDDDCPLCRAERQRHVYDDCPECRAEQIREQARRQRLQ
jgi:hypothetical protein